MINSAVEFSSDEDRQLRVVHAPMPQPAADEVRIRVAAAAIHPADVIAHNGGFDAMLPRRVSYRLGWDFAGTIDATGTAMKALVPGTPVHGMTNWLRDLNGTHAEYVVVARDQVVPSPAGLSPTEAAVLPVDSLTAWQALELLDVRDGMRLVVIGAAGSVGGFALELARLRGAEVVGVASTGDDDFVSSRGATFVERDQDVVAAVRGIFSDGADALLDTASLGAAALPMIKDGGAYCGVIAPLAPASERGISIDTVGVHSDASALDQLATLAGQGHLTPRVNATYPFDEAARAFEHAGTPGQRGAVLLTP